MVIADSGFWIALFNRSGIYHSVASHTMSTLDAALVATLPVVTEVTYLLLRRVNIAKAIEFLLRVPIPSHLPDHPV
jgi:predicted nucleic acid-binding protein